MAKKRQRGETDGEARGVTAPPSAAEVHSQTKRRKGGDRWKQVMLDAATLRECQMEGMAELEELDGGEALIFDPSVLSLDSVAESPESAVARVVSGKGKQRKTGKKKVKDSSQDSLSSDFTVKSAFKTPGHGREPVKASEEAADPASSHKSKSRKSVRSSSSDTRKNSTASDRSSAPARALYQSNASPTACGDAASASPPSRMPPRCTLDDATEQWQFVTELRTALPAWLSALDSSSEDLLHPAVLRALQDCRFFAPTPIQRSVLLAALRDRKDIVGAAETGSGKTLAYGVPIVCNLLAQALRRNEKEIEHKNKTKTLKKKRKMRVEGGGEAAGDAWPSSSDDEQEPEEASDSGEASSEAGKGAGNITGGPKSVGGKVDGPECLIVVPSRELALQVQRHLEALCVYTPLAAVCLVGGLALQKQLRLLGQVRPQIVIGTPGRLFAVIQDAQTSVSRSLALGGDNGIVDHEPVLGEESNGAGHPDRGTQNGEGNRRGRIERGQEFMASLHTLRFLVLDEADRLTQEGCFQEMEGLLDAIYKAQPSPKKAKNADTKRRRGNSRENDENAFALGECRKIQTFIFSATLAMDPSSRQKKKHRREAKDRQSVLQALMDRVHLRKKRLAVFDLSIKDGDTTKLKQSLSHADDPDWKFGKAGHPPGEHNHAAGPLKLPDGLSITALKTAAGEEELYLVLFLLKLFVSAPANEPLKVMIFVNAISYVYRLDPILSLVLGRDKHQACQRGGSKGAPLAEVVGLHSNLQQKQRLKRVERFQSANRAVIVCTDVACRGLDLKQVKEVIHFQAPRSPSIFVHRSGRTARAQQSGETVCVLSPTQVTEWLQVLKPVQINVGELDPPACMHKSSRVYSQLTKVKRILAIATQIESAGHHKAKERRATSWLKKAAQAADIMLDSDISEDEEASARSAAQARTTSILRTELSQLVKSLKLL
ncbi:DEAD/DEAH box helicase domain-containing protein [Toxoplasma gondii ME49]|uniref:ATP-dependent RNA helicase n=1 Tax=Toxoplasma gondii (strain ATCC 50611 / Me49) TaxID=508771 RepID=S8EYD0_TOXGM|nr:DEAD/DEAH box helicase domain-containing protein [Toxoplasma gondii ME49]EPT28431.1 DEAD/DEAH box helicase domain-containing protein [Toxoplasma gondii ME49]|eukprot:XP_018636618.1 DEAD/DEAH box helicase domain-containing protein [Toxoplasma gondii ME49]